MSRPAGSRERVAAELERCLCVADVAELAETRLTTEVRDFVAGGGGGEQAVVANRAAFAGLAVVPRVLTGVTSVETRCTLAGVPASMPIATAPAAYQALLHPEGEIALARAARAAAIPFTASILSSRSIEEIGAVGATTWFQLYWIGDRGLVRDMVGRAEAAGCAAIMITVDVPRMGRRLRDMRNGFALPPRIRAANLDSGRRSLAHEGAAGRSAIAVHTASAFAPGLTWDALGWLRDQTALPLIVKGVLDPQDARRAVEYGTDAVVVSNHGGRQLDGAVTAVAAVPEILDAVGDGAQVLMDGGVRTGTDVLKALALGAAGVLVGRPPLWGLAAGGEPGCSRVLALLRDELQDSLVLAGCRDLAAARRLTLRPSRSWAPPTRGERPWT